MTDLDQCFAWSLVECKFWEEADPLLKLLFLGSWTPMCCQSSMGLGRRLTVLGRRFCMNSKVLEGRPRIRPTSRCPWQSAEAYLMLAGTQRSLRLCAAYRSVT